MCDLFVSSNDTLLQFYNYKDLVIDGRDFKTFYLNVDYEDGDYQAILLVNESSGSEYNSLYEDLNFEETYQRYSEIEQSCTTARLKTPAADKILKYEARDVLFIDYLSDKSVDKKWDD